MNKTVCELFAGVGGFRVGLERPTPAGKPCGQTNGSPAASVRMPIIVTAPTSAKKIFTAMKISAS